MRLKLTFSPIRFLFIAFLLVVMTVQAIAQNPDPVQPSTVWTWITDHWAVIALVISETLPFLPTKVTGILEGVLAFMASFLKKK